MSSRLNNAKRNMGSGFINKIIFLVLQFIIRTTVIHTFGAEYLGLGSLLSSILQVLNMAELGFSSAVVFSLYEPIAKNDIDTICALLSFYRKVYKTIGVVILFAGICIMPFIKTIIKGEYPSDVNIYVLFGIYLINTVVSYLAFSYKNVIFSANQRQDILSNINALVNLIKFGIQIFFLLLYKNFYLYIIWNVIFTLIENIAVAYTTKKYYPQYVCYGKLDCALKANIIRQIKGLAIGQLSKTSRNSFDSIVLSLYLGLVDVAIYSNYYYVFNAVMGVLSIIVQSINAGIGNSIALESADKNYSDFRRLYYYFSWVGGICTICFACLYQPFMKLWIGDSLLASFQTMLLFCIYFYIVQMGLIRSAYTNAVGIWWEGRWIEILEMLLNLFLNFILGWKYGMQGILLATIITVFCFSIIGLTCVLHKVYFKRSAIDYFIESVKYAITTCIVGIISYNIVKQIDTTNMYGFTLAIVVTLIVSNFLFLLISSSFIKYRYCNLILIKIMGGVKK